MAIQLKNASVQIAPYWPTPPVDRIPDRDHLQQVPVVPAAVTAGTRRAYGSCWNRVLEHWGGRRLAPRCHRKSAGWWRI